jgi:regulator of cell morphogenesis and NO signaling
MPSRSLDVPLAPDRAADPASELPAAELVARIVERHHGYLRSALPSVAPLVERIAAVHGDRDPALVEVAAAFAALRARIEPHLVDEEERLFPALLSGRAGDPASAAALEQLRAEHAGIRSGLRRLRELTRGYAPPEWACRTYRRALAELEDLEADLGRHLRLEQEVLVARLAAAARALRPPLPPPPSPESR